MNHNSEKNREKMETYVLYEKITISHIGMIEKILTNIQK